MYQQKEKESMRKEPHNDLLNAIRLQSHVLFGNNVQLSDVELFCGGNNGVLSVDTSFNLCDSWVNDTCYFNKRLVNSDCHNPVFLGPTVIHFQKDSSIFCRFLLEMCAHNPKIRNLRTIGTDLEIAILNDFSSVLPNLNLLLCVYHLEQGDKQNISLT